MQIPLFARLILLVCLPLILAGCSRASANTQVDEDEPALMVILHLVDQIFKDGATGTNFSLQSNGGDPSERLLASLRAAGQTIEPRSAWVAPSPQERGRFIKLNVEELISQPTGTYTMECSYMVGPIPVSGFRAELECRDGRWNILGWTRTWAS